MDALCSEEQRRSTASANLRNALPHTSRAYFMVLVWRSSTEPCPLVPPATDYLWELVDGSLKPAFCTEAPAPEALLELRKCNYKNGCQRNSCSCKKNNLKCTDMCGCGDACQNVYPDRPVDVDGTEQLCRTIIRSTNIYINERSFRDLVYVSRTHDMGIDCLF